MPVVDTPPRIHLLAAVQAPRVVIIRRKPSKLFHVIVWNTRTDELEHGSWFRGRLYPLRCDVSFDGRWMVYLAMGINGEIWNGVCRLPWLKTIGEWDNGSTWHGGGWFDSPNSLAINFNPYLVDEFEKNGGLGELRQALPFRIEWYSNRDRSEDFGALLPRLHRDGWRRRGDFGKNQALNSKDYAVMCVDDPGWAWSPSQIHPKLLMYYRGYSGRRGHVLEFRMQDYPDLLDDHVEWATWDAIGQLIVARAGAVHRFSLDDIRDGNPSFSLDLTDLSPPWSQSDAQEPTESQP